MLPEQRLTAAPSLHIPDPPPAEPVPTPDDAERAAEAAVRAAHVEAEQLAESEPVLGTPGPPVSRRSPFMIGMLAAAGVAVTYELGHLILIASNVLALIGLSFFLAIGLEPAVRRLMTWRLPRPVAVAAVALGLAAVVLGFLAAAIPPLISQGLNFVQRVPDYWAQARQSNPTLGRLDTRFHVQDQVTHAFSGGTNGLGGLLGAGTVVLSATASTLTVVVLTSYLLADLPRIRKLIYRLVPAARRPRAILIGDQMFAKVGGYVVGNVITSLIAGGGTFVWLIVFRVPYPLLLAIMVALLDLVPVAGSTVAGVVVTLVAWSVSLPVALATLVFYVVYKLLEDYLIVPRIMGRAVEVPGVATLIAVLVGAAALGLIGALVAIPVAAAINILLRETVFPRLDNAEPTR